MSRTERAVAIVVWLLTMSGVGVAVYYGVSKLMGVAQVHWRGLVVPMAIIFWASSKDGFAFAFQFWRDLKRCFSGELLIVIDEEDVGA